MIEISFIILNLDLIKYPVFLLLGYNILNLKKIFDQ